MKRNFTRFFAASAVCLLISAVSFGQGNKKPSAVSDMYVISAKAGGVNFVSGKVSVIRVKGNREFLKKGDLLEAGDKILTNDGKAEILLNPGSFVRLAENSEFEFVTTSLDDLSVKLIRGSAIFEVITSKEFQIAVNSPDSRFYMLKSGVYRIDVNDEGTAKVEVWKGKAQLENGNATTLKGGQSINAGNAQAVVEKFDRDEKDDFELWSKDRAKELAKINAKLREREMNRALISSFGQNSFNSFGGFGLWVRDPWTQSYCFLPFGYGWRSPYGFGFNSDIWQYRLPQNIYYNINQNATAPNGQSPLPPPQTPGTQPNVGGNLPSNPQVSTPPISTPRESPEISRPQINSPGSIMDRKAEPRID